MPRTLSQKLLSGSKPLEKNCQSPGWSSVAVTACQPPGIVRMMAMVYPMEILQTPGQVTIIAEWEGQIRSVFAKQWVDSARPGWWYQRGGAWKQK